MLLWENISIFIIISSNAIAVTSPADNFKIIEKGCQSPVHQAMMTWSSGAAFLSFRIMEFRRKSVLNFPLIVFVFA